MPYKDSKKKSENAKKYYFENRDKIIKYNKQYRIEHPEIPKKWAIKNKKKLKKQRRIYNFKNRKRLTEQTRKWRHANKEKHRASSLKWYQNNKDKRNKYVQLRLKQNIHFKLRNNLGKRINHALIGHCKSNITINLIGCSIQFLKTFLESKFQPKMSWDNYCYNGWHVDHIIPCAAFDLLDPNQQRICFHYTNLQPLWAKDNFSKGKNNG